MHRTKAFAVEVEEKDGGAVVGDASTFDREPDSYGDVVAKGAFAESLEKWAELGKPIPLLFGHRVDDPFMNIGAVVNAEEDERGLKFEAVFDADNETAQYSRKLVKEGRIHQFSFAFDVLEAGPATLEDGRKVNELRKLDLFEISLVPIPANPNATVEDVKAGRVLSKTNEDDLREAIGLIQGVLDKLEAGEDDEPEDEPGQPATGEGEGDPAAETAGKGAPVAERMSRYL